jgi:predicted peptidase
MTGSVPYKYDLSLPKGYGSNDGGCPLILFLHGAQERGDDLELVKRHGPPKLRSGSQPPAFLAPFIVLSPQCPSEQGWAADVLASFLESLLEGKLRECNVDVDRVYLTGISMGGYGAWQLACKYPKCFAAVVPICGGGDPTLAKDLRDVPIWMFHSAGDQSVPVAESDRMFTALQQCNASVTFTRYQRLNHVQTWEEAYGHPLLYDWLLGQSRAKGAR